MSASLTQTERGELLRRARAAATKALGGAVETSGEPEASALWEPFGCFVTFKRRDIKQAGANLRGCLGTLDADRPLWRVVEEYAAETVLDDYRFRHHPVTLEEMQFLHIDISAIRPKRRLSDPLEFVLGEDGVEVVGVGRHAGYRGVYLPQVAAEFNLTKEQLLSSCCADKAGIPADAWRDGSKCQVWAFKAEVFGEDEAGKAVNIE